MKLLMLLEVLEDKELVDKVLRTLPMKYDSKVSTLEEQNDLKLMTIDELHGIFTAYEMRTGKNGSQRKKQHLKPYPRTNMRT